MKKHKIIIYILVTVLWISNSVYIVDAKEIVSVSSDCNSKIDTEEVAEDIDYKISVSNIDVRVGEKKYFNISTNEERIVDNLDVVSKNNNITICKCNPEDIVQENASLENVNEQDYITWYEVVGEQTGVDEILIKTRNEMLASIIVNIAAEEDEKIVDETPEETVVEGISESVGYSNEKPGWSEDGSYYTKDNGELAKGITCIGDTIYNFDKETGSLIKQAGWIEEDGKRYFSNAEGKIYRNQFISFGKTKYYMGDDGSVQKGIVRANDGNYYHMDETTGTLVRKAGWLECDGKRYFANAEGKLYRNQFISFGKTKYYMGDDGSVQKGIVRANDGNYYHMDETTGTLVRTAGWLECDGKRYFANAEGKIYRNQFISFGNTRYYMGDDGSVQKGIVRANDGNYYHMDETTGILVRTAGWLEYDGKRYFANAEGKLYRNQFISFGKTYYYCAEKAAIVQGQQYPVKGVLYTFDEKGVMQITPGWGEYNGRKYYINPSTGFPYKGWITFGQTVYYADANGLLVNGWQKINGYSYYFYSSNYVMARNTTIDGKRIGQDGRVAQYADRMAVFSTVSTNNENGTYNMSRALKSFNQVVIQPGQTLSFFSVAGPCGKAQGYKQAGVVGGVGYGGGICQASTTLYGAAVRAGLTIVQRRNHSVPSTYVPIGQDAMVDYGSSDLKFRNDYDYPVKLVTYVSGRTLYAEVWGMQPDWYDNINVRSWSTGVKSAVAYRDYVKNGKTVKTEQLPSSYYR